MKDKVLTIIAAVALVVVIIIAFSCNSALFTLFIIFCLTLIVPAESKSDMKDEKQSTTTEEVR